MICLKPIHLVQELVKRGLCLTVTNRVLALVSHGVDFIDEYHAGPLLLAELPCLSEEFTDAFGSQANVDFNKVASTSIQYRYFGLACSCLCHQSLTSSRLAIEKQSLGHGDTMLLEVTRPLKEVQNIKNSFLG